MKDTKDTKENKSNAIACAIIQGDLIELNKFDCELTNAISKQEEKEGIEMVELRDLKQHVSEALGKHAVKYFYARMAKGDIKNDLMQIAYDVAIEAIREKVSREKGSRWSKRFQIGDHVEYLADNLYSACGTITAIDQEKIVILVEAETVTTAYECCLHDFDEDREDTISWIDIDAISLAEKTERLHCNFNLNEFEVGDAVELSINGQSYKGTIVALHKPFFCVKFDDETTQRFIKWGVDNLKKIAPTKCE